jgi:hypothetical protein
MSSKKKSLAKKAKLNSGAATATNSFKLSSLNKSIESFFVKFLNKTNSGSVKKLKTANNASILNKSSPVKLINKYLFNEREANGDDHPAAKNEIMIKNFLNRLNSEQKVDDTKGSEDLKTSEKSPAQLEHTSILKYLMESLSSGGIGDQEASADDDGLNSRDQDQTANDSDDESYASFIVHDEDESFSSSGNNQTFLVHEKTDEIEETEIDLKLSLKGTLYTLHY